MEIKNIEIILETDDERAMINAIYIAFPGKNILRQITDKIQKSTIDRKEIVNMIFGANGVATANNSATFKDNKSFLQYYVRHAKNNLANYIMSSKKDQLWTNNNTESKNHRLKVKLNWES
ncbi:hypothetical protein ACJMK2_023514 [Sinanodonta woodiana]|uniref:Uncharacterized protein n=1 Tax=Sinanodonta woodiana TaxID=1069815 RepID=A0ABD3T5A9_SINWO